MTAASPFAAFDTLPLRERLFVRARAFSAPLNELVSRAEGASIADVGCGHGVLLAMLAARFPSASLVGIDVDARKIEWARASVGTLPNVRLECAGIDEVATRSPAQFDTVCIADVLYLLPPSNWASFLSAARRMLKPAGRLLLKEAEDDGSWRVTKALWQERVMVRLLGRTQSSGAVGFQPRAQTLEALSRAGFESREVVPLARGSTTPHVLFVAAVR